MVASCWASSWSRDFRTVLHRPAQMWPKHCCSCKASENAFERGRTSVRDLMDREIPWIAEFPGPNKLEQLVHESDRGLSVRTFRLREKRIVLAVEGKHRNVMFLIPPLAFSKDDAAHFLTQLSECLKCIEKLLSISDVPSEDREARSSTVEQQSCPAGPGTWKKKQRALNFLGKSPTDLDLSASSRLEDWLSQESQRFSL